MEQDHAKPVGPQRSSSAGMFSTEEADRARVADDFGHHIHRLPAAVLRPGSVEDVVRAVQLAGRQGWQIVPRGQGHMTGGQAQSAGGLVLDMRSLNAIGSVQADRVEVEAGALWSELLQKTLAQDLTPPVLTDYLDLSIGGVLAVGGIGGTSFRYGAIVDNVLAIQVVTNMGQVEHYSPTQQPERFQSVLAGLGQGDIILKAVLRLIPAKTHARVFHLAYPHLAALIHDHTLLLNEDRFDYLVSHILPTAQGTWSYVLEALSFYTPSITHLDNPQLLHRLNFLPETVQVEDPTYAAFSQRVARQAAALKELGVWQHPHPWFCAFLPASQVEPYGNEALAEISPSDLGPFPIILSGLHHKHFHIPSLRIPTEETFFLFSILRTAAPNSDAVAKALAHNQQLAMHVQALGGTIYPISSIDQ